MRGKGASRDPLVSGNIKEEKEIPLTKDVYIINEIPQRV